MKKPRYILWCDFETTGLDIETLAPIEVAFELTNIDLCLAGDETRARYSTFLPCHPSSSWEGGAYAMHVTSGLEEAWRAERRWRDNGEVEWRITEMLKEFGAADRSVVLGGSSVHFDRRVLERFMPKIVMLLSHRNYDVSTLLIEALASGMPPEWIAHLEASEHRAAADVARSIGLAKRLREWKHPIAPARRPEEGDLRTEFWTTVVGPGVMTVGIGNLNCSLLGVEIHDPEIELLGVSVAGLVGDSPIAGFPVRVYDEAVYLRLRVRGEPGMGRRVGGAYWSRP